MTLPARLHYHVRDESFSRPDDRIGIRPLRDGGAEIYSGTVSRFIPADASEYEVNQILNDIVRLRVSEKVPRIGRRGWSAHFPPFSDDRGWPGKLG
jgi:hypothetical protein